MTNNTTNNELNTDYLHTDNLTIGYDKDIVGNISIRAVPGQILTLIGPNGCGKSTLLKTLTGQLSARGGVIYLDGKNLDFFRVNEVARYISSVMTTVVKPELMTCREVVDTGRYPYTGRLGVLTEHDKQIIEDTLSMTGIQDISERAFMSLSDGQKQRVMLARAICQEPDILILDEPTSYLDIKYKLDILMQIKQLVRDKNIAVVMSLHELDIAMNISDTVAAIGDGKILRYGSPEEVFEEAFIRRLYGIEHADLSLIGTKPWYAGIGNKFGFNTENKRKQSITSDHHSSTNTRAIMIQGTMSNAGKSLLCAGLCRIFAEDGYNVAPFKSQNMALNSYITGDGGEMGRAQVVQAQCALKEPDVCMNPILLKPNDDRTSQIIVNGKAIGNMSAAEYFRYKKELIPVIREAYDKLAAENDIIVIEGAGSPVELNLKDNDIVNMGLAKITDASVLLAGDIDRGGIFAQLTGTLDLLEPEERERVKGLIVNKFRGDPALFDDGITILEEKSGTRVIGLVPFMDINIEDEDSLSDKLYVNQSGRLDIAVIRLPHLSNYTDFDIFTQLPATAVRYVRTLAELCKPDIVILPGTKNTVSDLEWMMAAGLGDAIRTLADDGTVIIGICGGYQMLGLSISENSDAASTGLHLLPIDTIMEKDKVTTEYTGQITEATGVLSGLSGLMVEGYEIHMGRSVPYEGVNEFTSGGTGYCKGNIYGTYVHGFFDRSEILAGILQSVGRARGKKIDTEGITDRAVYREQQYRLLANRLRESLDMDAIYEIIGLGRN